MLFERCAFTHQKAVLGGIADGRHDGCRRGKNQRTGTEYNEYGHGAYHFAREKPRKRCGG